MMRERRPSSSSSLIMERPALSLSSDAQTSFRSFVAFARGFLRLGRSALPSAKLFVGAANLFSELLGGSGSAAGA